jgi:hypothetical protein
MKLRTPRMMLVTAAIALASQSIPTNAFAYSFGSGTGGGCNSGWYNNRTPAPASVATTYIGICSTVFVDANANDWDNVTTQGFNASDYDPGWTTSSFHGIASSSSAFFFLVY